MDITIEQLTQVSDGDVAALTTLLHQLDASAKPLHKMDVDGMIHADANRLFVARDKETQTIVGMLTLIIYRIPVWQKGWIEDVVVDQAYRGKGIASALLQRAIDQAKKEQVRYLDLTSRPGKEIANKIYQKFGFEKRETNVYRMTL